MGDLDRRKHDVDIIERVIGDIQDSSDGPPRRVVDLEVPSAGGRQSIVELVVNISDERPTQPDHRREQASSRSS
jgi:hypothetical protein